MRLLYASSAAVYGGSDTFREEPAFERPLNVYGYSKLLFDNVVRRVLPTATTQVAGFRYFNVYGPHEQHKGRMASVAFHHFNQLRARAASSCSGRTAATAPASRRATSSSSTTSSRSTCGSSPIPRRAASSTSAAAGPSPSTTSPRRSSTRRAPSAAKRRCRWPRSSPPGTIEYIDFPAALVGKYQCFTEADLGSLRGVGCDHAFADVAQGVGRYAAALRAST